MLFQWQDFIHIVCTFLCITILPEIYFLSYLIVLLVTKLSTVKKMIINRMRTSEERIFIRKLSSEAQAVGGIKMMNKELIR